MNWNKLTAGLTVGQFNDIAENWYARLNRLKEDSLQQALSKKCYAYYRNDKQDDCNFQFIYTSQQTCTT